MQSDMIGVKAQLHLTGQKLGQIRAKSVSQANITRSDIATLMQRGNVSIAREKAEKLILEEAFQVVLQDIEIYLGVLLECFYEFEQKLPTSPTLIEAASTVIYAASYIRSKDLDACRNALVQQLGHNFAQSAIGNYGHHVPRSVLRNISTSIPSASQLDDYLKGIAEAYSVPWTPPPSSEYIITALSEILDVETQPEVDLSQLRKLCIQGIPDFPEWLRPRIWKLLFGVLSEKKASWKAEMKKQRNAYYDLVRRVLDPFRPSGANNFSGDRDLLAIYKQLSGLPGSVYSLLEGEPEISKPCPLDKDAPEDLKIPSASWLDTRLNILQNRVKEDSSPTPEIRLESEFLNTPGISLTSFDSPFPASTSTSTTLLPSRKCVFGNAHPKHCSSLLRLLYLHKSINPESPLTRSASILVPLYSVLTGEVDSEDLPHVEADAFWLFEAVLAEFSGLEDDAENWMKVLSERLRWADFDLYNDLEARGLDPSLPHYSYRWLMHMLAHTLPFHALFVTWDSLFSSPPQDKGSQPKLEHLVDICISMLIRSKAHLIRLGNIGQDVHSLWTNRLDYQPQSSKVQGKPHDPLVETLSFLRLYDPKYVGGIERVLQTASELAERRKLESINSQWPSIGASLKFNIWKGFKRQSQSNQTSAEGRSKHLSGEELKITGTSQQPSFQAQITDIIWRGITNHTAMRDETISPTSPQVSTVGNGQGGHLSMSASQESSVIWNYAGKLKDSDTIARLSKVGTNWRARGLLPSWNTTPWSTLDLSSESVRSGQDSASTSLSSSSKADIDSPLLSSPPIKSPLSGNVIYSSGGLSSPGSGKLIEKTKVLMSKTQSASPNPGPRSAPKPLLLNSATSIISGHTHPRSASAGSWSTPDTDEWADVINAKRHHFHKDSQSSVSSLSPSDAFGLTLKSTRSDKGTEPNPSRIVVLNRRSVSPMAPAFRLGHSRPPSRTSSVSSGSNSPSILNKSPLQQAGNASHSGVRVHPGISSQSTLPAPVPSVSSPILGKQYRDKGPDSFDTTSDELPIHRKTSLASPESGAESEDTASSAPVNVPNRTSRVRTKRYARPANLQIHDIQRPRVSAGMKTSSPSKLVVEWPEDDHDSIMTPRAANFDADNSPGLPKSPRRPRKISSGDPGRPKRSWTDNSSEHACNVSGGSRSWKTSSGSRDVSRSRRESAGVEGDDEGYDELLSAYESEDGPNVSSP